MHNLSRKIILDRVDLYSTYFKGQDYYRQGKVRSIRTTPNRDYFIANVYGKSIYETSAEFDINGDIYDTSCSCKAYKEYLGDCKHIVALLLFIKEFGEKKEKREEKEKREKKEKTEGSINSILSKYRDMEEREKTPVNLEINYKVEEEESTIDFRMGEERFYVVKNIGNLISQINNEEIIEFGKNFTYNPSLHSFKKEDKELIDFLTILYENYEKNHSYYDNSYNTTFKGKFIKLTPKSLEKFFDLMMGRKLNISIEGHEFKDTTIVEEKLDLHFGLRGEDKDLILDLREKEMFIPLKSDGRYFFYKDKIYKIPKAQGKTIMPILDEIVHKDIMAIRIKEELKETFVSEILLNVKNNTKLTIDKEVEEAIYSKELDATIYFDRKGEVILGKLEFSYGDMAINPFSANEKKEKGNNQILLRDIEKERKIMDLLEYGDFKVENGGFYLEEEEQIFDFINDIIPKLQDYCEIYYSESFKNIGIVGSQSLSGEMRISSDLDMLEFHFDIEGIDVSELDNIFKALKEKKKYYKLKNGSFLPLDNNGLSNVIDLLDYLDIKGKALGDGYIKIPKFRAMYLDKFIEDRQMDFIKKNVNVKKLVRDISEPEDMEYKLPKTLKADLRDYQKFGFKWLKTLSSYGFGGILADEMGLGKTVQMITFLLSEKEEKGKETSIIIVPTSLVYNWEEEVNKFGPSLKTLIVSGNKEERKELIKTVKDYDLIITSYPLIRKDIEDYKDVNFRFCVLDEAQHIKNKGSLSAKSVKNIQAKNYFALTGTPMENSLSELWSIFDFLMPGYLLNSRKFTDKYEKPIIKKKDETKLRELNNHIRPFILRRLKKEVLKELPDKIEQKIVVDMTKEQKQLYLAYLQDIKGEINESVSVEGYGKNHIKILAGLTRLRQLCCHPGVFVENYRGGSGKLDSLDEIVSEALRGGHRILIFSQFTTMLDKIKKHLEDKDIETFYLDGSTPMIERGKLVRDFNKGKGEVFLISLKAGGTGLNLTSADMVIHFDPWWNPAVEDQATDRAHRIGQENRVQVIKLITKGTIEEKIFKLQEKKKEIIDKVIREGETLISKLSEEEIMSLFQD